jgi:Raf kinase inhibitor-like YbhB/YbcL family protein
MIRFFGRRLRGWRAGPELRTGEDVRFSEVPRSIVLRSAAFEFGERMPPATTSPPLAWTGVPPEAKTLVLVVEDVDVPFPRPLTHAVAFAIDPSTTALGAGALDGTQLAMGYNGAGGRGYVVPAPIPGHGPHRYVFTLLAVDFEPRFDQPPTKGRLLDAVAGHVVALGELMGTLER